jgi:hypothetical protein
MPLYTLCIVEYRCYHSQSTERSCEGPERAQDVSNILLLFLTISQKSRYWCGQFVQRRSRYDAVKVPVNVKVPAIGVLKDTHFEVHMDQSQASKDKGRKPDMKTALRISKSASHCAISGVAHTIGPEPNPTR